MSVMLSSRRIITARSSISSFASSIVSQISSSFSDNDQPGGLRLRSQLLVRASCIVRKRILGVCHGPNPKMGFADSLAEGAEAR